MFGYLSVQICFHKRRITELTGVRERNVSILNPANPVILSKNSNVLEKGPASDASEKAI
jgi:hypothetical protein